MKPPLKTFGLAVACLGILFFSGCERADVPVLQTGKRCTIQFRRDALGAGANLPIPPTTGSINGAATSIEGTLRRVTAEWVVIERNGEEISVPKGVILLIQQSVP